MAEREVGGELWANEERDILCGWVWGTSVFS